MLKDCKNRHTNLAMAWIDYKKAYYMVPHIWVYECLELLGVAENVRTSLISSMANWKLELTSCEQSLGDVDVRREIVQGDSLSPILFVLCLIPLTLALQEVKACYEWILEVDSVLNEGEMKIQCQKECKRRLRIVLRSKLNGKNKIQAINT